MIKRNGENNAWHQNGQLWVKNTYVKDKLHGEFKNWDKDGNLIVDTV
jgi:antitoxin component YwqK of YwqJK toxin-antitoxin module